MATSGTIGSTTFDTAQVIDKAARKCGLTTGQISDEILEIASDALYLYLSSMSNHGPNLWTMTKKPLALVEGQPNYAFPTGTIEISKLLLRQHTIQSGGTPAASEGTAANAFDGDYSTACTQVAINGNISYDFGTAATPLIFGLMPNGAQTYTPAWEYSDDNVSWTTLQTDPATTYTDRVFTWTDVVKGVSHRYWRVRETAGGILNVREIVFVTAVTEIEMGRQNKDQYQSLPDKLRQSQRPLQWWYDRQLTPQAWVWPCPNDARNFSMVAWFTRHIMDIGALTNTIEVPQRWIEAVTCELAYRLAGELPDQILQQLPSLTEQKIARLQKDAVMKTAEAEDEERDKSPILWAPDISVYTR